MSAHPHCHRRDDSESSADTRRADSQTSHRTRSTALTDYGSQRSGVDAMDDGVEYSQPKLLSHDRFYASNESFGASSTSQSYEDGFPPGAVEYGGSIESSKGSSELYDDVDDDYEVDVHSHPLPPTLDVRPATSQDFSELFPSSRELKIRHDDSTMDGNMNLSIQTPVTTSCGYSRSIVLFHLRMYDLKTRDFSLRRYCRESGREIVHSTQKSSRAASSGRPGLQRSWTTALAAFKSKSELKQAPPTSLKRHDSGYDSMHSDDELEADQERPCSSHSNKAPAANASDVVALEFSNYAHVDIRRRGFKSDKRYDFDYWGGSYSWKKSTQRLGKHTKETSYHLIRRSDHHVVARIFPEPLSESEAKTEVEKGGWIPPCSMRITDQKILSKRLGDLADVFVATGLIALVDDCIRRHFQRSETRQLILPMPKLISFRPKRNPVDPKLLVDDTFGGASSEAARVRSSPSL